MTKCARNPCGCRRSYEYFERLTFIRVVRGLSVNEGRVKEEGNEARNTLVGMRELTCLVSFGGGKGGTVAPCAADPR
jgi:hypothetical protein